jgi:hypothetical protein
MSRSPLRLVLQGVLLASAPFALSDCSSTSSCPDNGYEPPVTSAAAIDASLANGGPLSATQCEQVCDFGETVVTCVRESAESVLCFEYPFPCEGRRPQGLQEAPRTTRSGFDCHLADAAWLEAASVDAFRVLRRELRAHGAPRRLLRAASRSARDERRHARVTKAVARSFGVAVALVQRDAPQPRSLSALALENAVEGCVRETWGALIAIRQGSRASERTIRAAMASIARDEIRHAELAWSIDAWLRPRLSADEQEQVSEARARAVAELSRDLETPLPQAERERLGLPGAQEASQLLRQLDRSLGLSRPRRPERRQ